MKIVVEEFANRKRMFTHHDFDVTLRSIFPQGVSFGVSTGTFDIDGREICTNHLVKFKGNLCKIELVKGTFCIKHGKYGYCELGKWAKQCKINE